MDEGKLRAIIFVCLKTHAFNHNGRCVCGEFTSKDPTEILLHMELELTKAIMAKFD